MVKAEILFDCVRRQHVEGLYFRSGVVMPMWSEIRVTSLGCSKVTKTLKTCRDSSVYKRFRKLIWRFHLDLEDLNKRRQLQWVPLAENCIALINRMMEDLGKGYSFKDRWARGRYSIMLGDWQGREPGTIFYMFAVSIPYMYRGIKYAQEARMVLHEVGRVVVIR